MAQWHTKDHLVPSKGYRSTLDTVSWVTQWGIWPINACDTYLQVVFGTSRGRNQDETT